MNESTIDIQDKTTSVIPLIQSEHSVISINKPMAENRIPNVTNLKYSPVMLSFWEKRVCDVLLEVDLDYKKCVEVVKGRFNKEFNCRQIERWVMGSRNRTSPGRTHIIEYLQKGIARKGNIENWDINRVKGTLIDIVEGSKALNDMQMRALESIKDLEMRKVTNKEGTRMAVQINFGERKE